MNTNNKDYQDAIELAKAMQANGTQLGTIITKWLKAGKAGMTVLLTFAEQMKQDENHLALETIKRASKRYFKAEKLDLSIKGLGIKTENARKQKPEISPKEKASNSGGKVEQKQAESLDTETVWDYVVERFTKDELDALVDAWKTAHKIK